MSDTSSSSSSGLSVAAPSPYRTRSTVSQGRGVACRIPCGPAGSGGSLSDSAGPRWRARWLTRSTTTWTDPREGRGAGTSRTQSAMTVSWPRPSPRRLHPPAVSGTSIRMTTRGDCMTVRGAVAPQDRIRRGPLRRTPMPSTGPKAPSDSTQECPSPWHLERSRTSCPIANRVRSRRSGFRDTVGRIYSTASRRLGVHWRQPVCRAPPWIPRSRTSSTFPVESTGTERGSLIRSSSSLGFRPWRARLPSGNTPSTSWTPQEASSPRRSLG